jgi:hypothetical protein
VACILRAEGALFDVPAFLKDSPLQPGRVYQLGEPLFPDKPGGPARNASGFDLAISAGTPADLEMQTEDAIEFLDVHEEELRRLGSFPGVDAVTMEFGLPWGEAAAQTTLFPSDLLWRAGALDISLQVTHYLVARQ